MANAPAVLERAPAALEYDIQAATELFLDPDSPPKNRQQVLYVHEYPVFKGNQGAANKANAIFDTIKKQHHTPPRTPHPNARVRQRTNNPSYQDYLQELVAPGMQDSTWFDITTCSVNDSKTDVISISQRVDWWMGGVHDIVFNNRTLRKATGDEVPITDVMVGTKQEITNLLQREFEAQHGESLGPASGNIDHLYYLSKDGLVYTHDNLFGYQRGSLVTIPYSRKDLIKPPFAK
jgi:hypothetical protein